MKKTCVYLLWLSLLVMSCDDLAMIDTTAPHLEVEEPAMGGALIAGEFAHFEARFIDDVELATFNIEVHDNFGGHSHGRLAATSNDPSLIKWSYKQSFLIPEGLTLYQAVLEEEIEVPVNALAGPYHFIVQAIDKVGNSTSFQDDSAVELEIYVKNNEQAVVDITNLVDDELELENDISFMVEGTVSDPTIGEYKGLQSIDVILGEGIHDDHDHSHGGRTTEEDLIDIHFEEEELQQFMVDDEIILEKLFALIDFNISQTQLDDLSSEGIDHLLLAIVVFDQQENITVSSTDVHLHFE